MAEKWLYIVQMIVCVILETLGDEEPQGDLGELLLIQLFYTSVHQEPDSRV